MCLRCWVWLTDKGTLGEEPPLKCIVFSASSLFFLFSLKIGLSGCVKWGRINYFSCFAPLSLLSWFVQLCWQKLLSSVPEIKHFCCAWLFLYMLFYWTSLSEGCVCGACCYQTRDIKISWRGVQPNPTVRRFMVKRVSLWVCLWGDTASLMEFSSPVSPCYSEHSSSPDVVSPHDKSH